MMRCPICQHESPAKRQTDNWWRCYSCKALHRQKMPSEGDLDALYQSSWQKPDDHETETGNTCNRLARLYATALLRRLGRRDFHGLRILDFGAGRGTMTVTLTQLGADVWAVEPYGSEYLQEQGFRVFRTIDDIPCDILFDGIVGIEVVEHLTDCIGSIEELGQRLKQGGWLYLSTPNMHGLRSRLQGARWSQRHNPGHITLYSAQSMSHLLRASGLPNHQRLHWHIPFYGRFVRDAIQYLLYKLNLAGGLRYLAWKGDDFKHRSSATQPDSQQRIVQVGRA